MEQWLIQGLISGTIANAITSLVIGTVSKSSSSQKKLFRQDLGIDKILKKATVSAFNTIELDDDKFAEKLRLFLSSPDVESIVRQIYANKLTPEKQVVREQVPEKQKFVYPEKTTNVSDDNISNIYNTSFITVSVDNISYIKDEFLACLSLYLNKDYHAIKEISDELFETLLESCEIALMEATDKGQLSAHEAMSSLRYNMLANELATIKKNLNFLNSEKKLSIQEILEFEKRYLQQIRTRHGYVIPPYFGVAKKVPISDIFIDPSFLSFSSKNVIDIQSFLSMSYRAIILGNPGAGKSTFALKFCHDLATNYDKRIFSGRQVIPILVTLRHYGAYKKENKSSIREFIEMTSNCDYQIKPPAGVFEYMFLNGHAVVIFDGLDELIETRYRQEMSSDIEAFCTLYPSVPVIITSREVGYYEAPLNKNFEIFRLNSFDENQVREYTTKWFSIDEDLTQEQQKQKAISFLRESQVVPDIRSNPLLLSLMCNIYKGENYIPKNRPDVYEKCSLMLFERWDKSRGINYPLPFEAHIKPTMMYLANWIYSNEKLDGGVTENNLIAETIKYLCPKRFEDYYEAEKAAIEFIEFCRGRAWVFTEIGTTKEGESLYQFTHRTFLEYFTAAYLVRINTTPFALISLFLPKIAKREWDVVAQLAFQLQSKNKEDAGDELLIALIKRISEAKGDEKWNILSFVVRCLEFMVPSPKIVRDITITWFELNTNLCLENIKQKMVSRKKMSLYKYGEFVADILYVSTDNRKTVAETLKKLIHSRVQSENEPEAVLALEIGLYFTLISSNNDSEENNLKLDNNVLDFWRMFSDSIYEEFSERILALSRKYFCLCNESFKRGKISITSIVEWYGFTGVFNSCDKYPSPAEVLMEYIRSYSCQEDQQRLNDLGNLSLILLSSSPAWWIKGHKVYPSFYLRRSSQVYIKDARGSLNLNCDILFSAFALFAAMLESVDAVERLEIINWIKANQNPFFDHIGVILVARFLETKIDKIQEKVVSCGFNEKQQFFVYKWIKREINLVMANN